MIIHDNQGWDGIIKAIYMRFESSNHIPHHKLRGANHMTKTIAGHLTGYVDISMMSAFRIRCCKRKYFLTTN